MKLGLGFGDLQKSELSNRLNSRLFERGGRQSREDEGICSAASRDGEAEER